MGEDDYKCKGLPYEFDPANNILIELNNRGCADSIYNYSMLWLRDIDTDSILDSVRFYYTRTVFEEDTTYTIYLAGNYNIYYHNGFLWHVVRESHTGNLILQKRRLNGEIVWETETLLEDFSSWVYSKDESRMVFVSSEKFNIGDTAVLQNIYFIDTHSGATLWRRSTPYANPHHFAISDDKTRILGYSSPCKVYVYDAYNGNIIWAKEKPNCSMTIDCDGAIWQGTTSKYYIILYGSRIRPYGRGGFTPHGFLIYDDQGNLVFHGIIPEKTSLYSHPRIKITKDRFIIITNDRRILTYKLRF